MGELMDVVFPGRCVVCGELLSENMKYICDDCLSDLPFTYFWSWENNPAERILYGRAHFDRVCSLFYYSRDNSYSSLVRKLKYAGNTSLGIYLGNMLGEFMRERFCNTDYIIPVPVHFLRHWKRGYNQSEYVAAGIKAGLGSGKVLKNALIRKKYSNSQTTISMGSKWHNVENSFRLRKSVKKALEGKNILLVDDVLTSGATSEVCYDALSEIKGARISFATLAYVLK